MCVLKPAGIPAGSSVNQAPPARRYGRPLEDARLESKRVWQPGWPGRQTTHSKSF